MTRLPQNLRTVRNGSRVARAPAVFQVRIQALQSTAAMGGAPFSHAAAHNDVEGEMMAHPAMCAFPRPAARPASQRGSSFRQQRTSGAGCQLRGAG